MVGIGLRRLAVDERGAVSVEFAMVALAFIMFVLVVFDLGRSFWNKATLQSVAEDTARCYAVQKPQNDATLTCSSSAKAKDYADGLASARGVPIAAKATDILIYDATVGAEKASADAACGATTTMVYVYLKITYSPILPFEFLYPSSLIEGKACYPIV